MSSNLALVVVRRWLLVAVGGAGAVAVGLVVDVGLHARDAGLAAREGPLTLTNPGHLAVLVGLAAISGGLAGAAWTAWRPTPRHPRLVASALALLAVAGAMGAVAAVSGTGAVHDADDGANHESVADAGDGPGFRNHALAPYDERYVNATPDDRDAADTLLAEVRAALVAYADVEAAMAAGYRPPADRRTGALHYRNQRFQRDEAVLDPTRPEGLVYYAAPGQEPVLMGAQFVVPRGRRAPTPAGDLVVWHSHDPDCPAVFATDDEPCTETKRSLHVWTFDVIDMARGRARRTVAVRVTDPFGVPIRVATEPVGAR